MKNRAVFFAWAALILLLSGKNSWAQRQGGRIVAKPAFQPIPVQNYAVVDMSGMVTTDPVGAIALSDSNEAAFVATPIVNGNIFDATGWQSYTWRNGQTNLSASVADVATPFRDLEYYGDGSMIDVQGNIYIVDGVSTECKISGTPTGSSLEELRAPVPPYRVDPESQVSAAAGSYTFNLDSSGETYCYGVGGEVYYYSDGNSGSVIVGKKANGDSVTTIFNPTVRPSTGSAPSDAGDPVTDPNVSVVATSFLPWKSNVLGHGLGDHYFSAGYVYSRFWNGQSVATLPFSALALNDKDEIIGTTPVSYSSYKPDQPHVTAWLWQNGQAKDFMTLIPKAYRKQTHILGINTMSNRDTAATGKIPALNIVFSASILIEPDKKTYRNATLLLQQLGDGTWDLHEIHPMTNASVWNVNNQGVIAAVGSAGTTNGHALLLFPADVIADSNGNCQVDASDQVLSYVRFGLWDRAFDVNGDLLNKNDERNNFIGSDSRRFYLRVRYPSSSKGSNHPGTLAVHWYTVDAAGADDDHPGLSGQPGTDTITLTETSAGSGIFASKALMLVADDVDDGDGGTFTNTGLPGTNTGLSSNATAARGAADHRLRRATLGDKMCFSFSPFNTGTALAVISLPIFDQTPSASTDAIKTLNVQIVNTTGMINGVPVLAIPNSRSSYINTIISTIRQRYAIAGVNANISYNPANDLIVLPPAANANPNGVNLDDVHWGNVITSDELALFNALRQKYGSSNIQSNTVYVIVIGRFAVATVQQGPQQLRGQSFPSQYHQNSVENNCAIVAEVMDDPTEISFMTPPHEIGHLLLNRVPGDSPEGGHYEGKDVKLNLMIAGPDRNKSNRGKVNDSKRLWDRTSHVSAALYQGGGQLEYLRASPLLH